MINDRFETTQQRSKSAPWIRTRKGCQGRFLGVESLESRLVCAAISVWAPRGAGGGGAFFSPSINPHDAQQMYVASDMSELFVTGNAGDSWRPMDFRTMQGNSGSQVQFTSNPAIRYVIDRRPDGLLEGAWPARSTDGGLTWNHLASDPTGGECYSVHVDYAHPERVLISDYQHLYISQDGGQSFALAHTAADTIHVSGALFTGNTIFVGTKNGMLVSSNAGQSFQMSGIGGIPADQGIVSFAGGQENGVTRLFAVTLDAGDVYGGVTGAEHSGYRSVYRLHVGDPQWTPVTSGIAPTANPFFVAMASNEIDEAYLAGGSDQGTPTVFRTTNGGASWQDTLLTQNNANVATGWAGAGGDRDWTYGEYALGFTVDSHNPRRLLLADLGFVHFSEDGGASWRVVNVAPADRNPAGLSTPRGRAYRTSGLDNDSVWDLTWANADNLIASASDIRGIRSDDGGTSWSFNYSGHTQNTMYQSVLHANGRIYAATATVHDMYQTTRLRDLEIDAGGGRVLYSSDLGRTWVLAHDFGRVVTGVAADPTRPNRLYAAVAHSTQGGIYVTDNIQDGGASVWRKLANPPRTQGHAFRVQVLGDGSVLATFSARRAGSPLAFTASSGVFLSTDGGTTWLDRSDAGMRYYTKDVIVDPHDPSQSTWYAGVWSGWGGPPNGLGGLYRTTDRGQSWTRILARDRVSSATISPTDPNEVYVSTETEGLWYASDLRGALPHFSQVAGFPFRQPERVFYNPHDPAEVWVTTFGNTMYVGRATADPGDFDENGALNCEDIDSLIAEIARGTHAAGFDLTADSLVNTLDRDRWLQIAGAVNLGAGHRYLLGDANLDGVVDGSDFNRWNSHKFTATAAWCQGDFTADGVVDGSDFNVWNAGKFTTSDSNPKPTLGDNDTGFQPVSLTFLNHSTKALFKYRVPGPGEVRPINEVPPINKYRETGPPSVLQESRHKYRVQALATITTASEPKFFQSGKRISFISFAAFASFRR